MHALILLLAVSQATHGSFQAGFGSAVITPNEPVPLAGFAAAVRRVEHPNVFTDSAWHLFKPNTGVHDDVEAKAMVIEQEGRKLAIVGVDLIAVTGDVLAKVAALVHDLGYDESTLVIGASHTHSGPGAISPMPLWQALAVDLYKERIAKTLIGNIALAIRRADANLSPAKLAIGAADVEGVVVNRRGLADLQPRMVVVRVDALDGTPKGLLYNYPIHGVSLGADNLQLTADNIGYTRRAIEAKLPGVTAVYINGAEGDVTPLAREFEGAAQIGEALSAGAVGVYNQLQPSAELTFDMDARTIDLPDSAIHVQACEKDVAEWVGALVPLHVQIAEPQAFFRAFRFNDSIFVTLPGEALTQIGQTIEQRILNSTAFRSAYLLGLTNGHVGYLLSETEYDRGGLESCTSIYGRHFGPWMVDEVTAFASQLSSGATPRGGGFTLPRHFGEGCASVSPVWFLVALVIARRRRSAP